jgi:tetratricopeptide (TPR) repeat protein
VRRFLTSVLALVGITASTLQAQWPITQLKNVKALPPDIAVSALIDTMKGFTRALGVRCTYCHVGREDQDLSEYDFASDDRPAKEKARAMIRMVAAINTQYLANLAMRRDPPIVVTCSTCHRGVTQPRTIQQVILTAYQAGGITAADSTYQALRLRYYGSAAYDFGEVPLTDVAATLQTQGKTADALRLYKLNTQLLPTSGFAYRQLGFGYLTAADTASALAAFSKRLELQPDNPEAKQLVATLSRKPLP